MAQCFSAKKSKAGKPIVCGRCGAKIVPGENYFYFSVGFRGSKQVRCKDHRPRPSELCGSKLSGVYAAIEDVDDIIGTAKTNEEIADALESAASDVETVRDEYQESWDNLGDNFQNGQPGDDIQEKIDACDEFATSLNDMATEVRDLCAEDFEDPEDLLTDAIDKATDVIGEFSL